MLVPLFICTVLYPIVDGKFRPEPRVVGGRYIDITTVPHSAALHIKCIAQDNNVRYWLCGSSIVNQRLLLTAAHCADNCLSKSYIIAHVGDINKHNPNIYFALSYLLHDNYKAGIISNDIALVSTRTSLKFSSTVRRVALMKNPPYKEKALVAGWGYVDVSNFTYHCIKERELFEFERIKSKSIMFIGTAKMTHSLGLQTKYKPVIWQPR